MAILKTGTRIYGTANVDNQLTVGSLLTSNVTRSTSNSTGTIILTGNGGIATRGNIYSGNIVITGAVNSNGITFTDGTRQVRSGLEKGNTQTQTLSGDVAFTQDIIARGTIINDTGNSTVVFGVTSPILVQNSASSTSNTTGALIVSGGLGVTGNLFMSTANNYYTTTTGASYRFGWADNYFYRDDRFNGLNYVGNYLNMASGSLIISSALVLRTYAFNDSGNNVVVFGSSSPVLLQNSAASTSNTSGALIVSGGVGLTGNLYSGNVYITGPSSGITFADGSKQTTAATGGGGGGPTTAFSRIIISGQPDAIANIANSPLTLVAGSGISLATNGVANAITITSTGGGGGVSASGYLANSVIIANSTGYLSNTSNLLYYSANNTLALTGNVSVRGSVSSNSNATGTMVVTGGVGVTGNIYVGSSGVVGFSNTTNKSTVYMIYNQATNSLDTIFG